MADGPTYQSALANTQVLIQEWIATVKELGRPVQDLVREPRKGGDAGWCVVRVYLSVV
jgi:predicted RNase H-like HicB family nuclease